MKVVVLYRRESDHGRTVEEFVHEFQRLHHGIKLEEQSLDTRQGAVTAKLYDITRYPAILALKDDLTMLNIWQGDELPLISNVASYVSMG